MARLNMLDIAKLSGNDATVGLIEANIRFAPEAGQFPFRTIKGTSYKTGIRTGLPTVGFRNANEGQVPGKSSFEQKIIEAFIFGGQIEVDKAVADADERGEAFVKALEADGVMMASMRAIGSQIWYGITADSKGFPGLKAATPKGGLTINGDALTVDATGTTANTASSVYAVKYGDKDITLIGGNNSAFTLGEWNTQQITNPDGKKLTAHVAGLTAWIGMQVGNENCVRRLINLTDDVGHGLTDARLALLRATFPVGFEPDAYWMSRRSRAQLQTSRTIALMATGKIRTDQPNVAPLPTEYEGTPIFVTESIGNADAIE